MLSEFYHNHPEVRRIGYHKGFTASHDNVCDYGSETVREYYKAFIAEALERYDTDGVELDFMRDFMYFAPGGEYDGLEILNGFMREIVELVEAAEVRYGHGIRIAVRVPVSVELCYDYGFDILTWMSEHLVDTVCPTPHWSTADSDIPVHVWKRLTEKYGGELCEYIGTEPPCAYSKFEELCYRIPASAHGELLVPEIILRGEPVTVTYVEIEVKPAR